MKMANLGLIFGVLNREVLPAEVYVGEVPLVI
jgi:hypothetical protein